MIPLPPCRSRSRRASLRPTAGLLLALVAAAPGALTAQTVTLRQVADSALAHHPTVGAARAAVERSEAGVRAARASLFPSLAASSQLTRFEEPMVVAPLHGFDPTRPPDFDRTLVQSRVGVEYTLFDGGGRGAAARAARSRAGIADARLDDARAALLEAAVGAYLAVGVSREVRAAAALRVRALETEESRARQAFDEGTAARVEVLRAQAARTDAEAAQATARASVEVAEARLARLTGVEPAAVAEWSVQIPDPAGDEAGAAGIQADSLPGATPRVRAARRAVAAAEAGLAGERAGRLPTLRGSAGLVNYASGGGASATEWQAGVQVSWPVFTGGARGAAIDGARAELARAREEFRLALLEEADADDAAGAALVEAVTRLGALEASVAQWEEVARIEALRLENGTGTQSDLLQAEAGLFQARAGAVRARSDMILARVRLARARGALTRSWMDTELETQP